MRFLLFLFYVILTPLNIYAQDYLVADFNIKNDGTSLNTEAIQLTIDKISAEGGGRLIFDAGKYLTGSIRMKSNVELHLKEGAVLLGSSKPEHYYKLSRWKALILSENANNIAITGKGEINGQGRALALHIDSLFYAGQIDSADYNFVERRPKYYLRPLIIQFLKSSNIEVRGITLKNSSCWVQDYNACRNVVIDQIRVESDAYWNNDGIDISDCKNVRLTNSFFDSSDDGICLKSHFDDLSCDSIYIANCTVRSSASAIKLGTRSSGGFKNVHIENIKIYDTFRSAIAVECVDGGVLENVLIENIEAKNTGNAIFIRLAKRYKKRPASTLRNVHIRNVKVEVAFERPDYAYEVRGPALPFFHNIFPSSITGIPGHPVENVHLENIEIEYPGKGNKGLAYRPLAFLDQIPEEITAYPEFSMFGELPAWGFYVRHMNGLQMSNIKLSIQSPDFRHAMVFDDVEGLSIQNMKVNGDRKPINMILKNCKKLDLESMETAKVW